MKCYRIKCRGVRVYKKRPFWYPRRRELCCTPRQKVVFVGDSITARCDVYRCYKDFHCFNMGKSGSTLAYFVSTYDNSKSSMTSLYPKAIVFLMGINDVVFDHADANALRPLYTSLFERLKSDFPHVPVFVQSVYPACPSYEEVFQLPENINSIIADINVMLADLCEKYRFRFVDLYSALLKDGELNIDYAADRIHVNERCYSVVSAIISEALRDELGKNVLDIHSKGEYPSNALSNFYPHRFEFQGVICESMEGFLQSLKFRSRRKQRKICKMSGIEAKEAGSKKRLWKKTFKVYWKGRAYDRRTARFQVLIKSAFDALSQNEDFVKALETTGDMQLVHSIGLRNINETILTEDEFICNLQRLRYAIQFKGPKYSDI